MSPTDAPSLTIDPEACRHDGLCARVCPMGVFAPRDRAAPAVRHPEECVLCGHCLAVCPAGAIAHGGLDRARLRPDLPGTLPSPEQAQALLSQRRSVRNYAKAPPPRELLERVIEVAGHAPGSPHHRLGWVRGFTVVIGEAEMRRVGELTVEYLRQVRGLLESVWVRWAARFAPSARAGLEVLPDLAMRIAEWDRGRDLVTYRAPAAVFAHAPVASSKPQTDCDAALMSVLLNAHANGLGTCWNGLLADAAQGSHLRGFRALHRFLEIPEDHRCFAAATIGYPSLRLRAVPPRSVSVTWIGGGAP